MGKYAQHHYWRGVSTRRVLHSIPDPDDPTPPLVSLPSNFSPGPRVTTDEEILAFIRQDAIELYHASATCAMGKKGDLMAVVDSNARVFGVQGLRVVDASAFPFLPPGHPQSTVYALAEKIADDIKRGR